jgi:hypothetical protein
MRLTLPLGAFVLALMLPLAARAGEAPPPPDSSAKTAEPVVYNPIATPMGNLTHIEMESSTVMQEGQSSFSGMGIRVRMTSPRLDPHIQIMPNIEWWRSSNTMTQYDIETTRKDATPGVDAVWDFRDAQFKPYVGAGFALHFLSEKLAAPSLNLNESHSLTKGGLTLLGGASFALTGHFETFLDMKYHHVPDYRQLKINWGVSYVL